MQNLQDIINEQQEDTNYGRELGRFGVKIQRADRIESRWEYNAFTSYYLVEKGFSPEATTEIIYDFDACETTTGCYITQKDIDEGILRYKWLFYDDSAEDGILKPGYYATFDNDGTNFEARFDTEKDLVTYLLMKSWQD